jgi:uncharacterized protein YjbJ (UPF0337 family)
VNKDQIKGAVKEVAGKVQSKVGHATGSIKQEAKGVLKEAGGKFQKEYGNAREDSRKKNEAGKGTKSR